MLSVTDLQNRTEPFTHFQGLKRTRKVNGEKTIELTVLPTEKNAHAFNLIEEESIINALDDDYVIKKLTEQSRGKKYIKQVTAIHEFFVNLINKQQPMIHNGSITFQNYMQMVFEDTPYTFAAIDFFPARSFENLGNDNRLALLQKGLDRFKAEFELVGNQVRFKERIGNDTDFQFRYGHNIKSIKREVDTTNLATRITGTGDPELGIEAEYISPNAAIFGIIDAPPVNDERFKSNESLLEEMKRRLQDEPLVTITLDFVDLRAAGYPYTVPNEGDRVFVIYEPMDDLLIETRIMEIVEYFDTNLNVIKTEVTLSNHKKSFAGTMFDNVRKQLNEIVDDDGIIRYNVLDDAVKIATEALQRAQTELIFENGIIARDKNDPNRLVLFNSEGIGISDDGGHTFREAITADGFVLTAGAIGRLSANHIQIGSGTEFEPNYDPSTKETPQGAQTKADKAEENAKGYADQEYGPVKDTVEQNQNVWNRAAIFNEDGTLNTNVLKGLLTDEQIASAAQWNAQGTYIDKNGVYTGIIVAEQIVGGSLIGEEFYGGTFKGAEFEQIGTDGSMLVDDDGIKIFNRAGNLRAAILLGGTQGIENTLGLTLIDNNKSVFEINQDGQRATVLSKITLDIESTKDVNIMAGDDVVIENNGQIKLENRGGVSRGIELPEGHVITTHASDRSLAVYPNVRNAENGDNVFRIRAHENRTNYTELLRIQKRVGGFEIRGGTSFSLGENAASNVRGFHIGFQPHVKWVSFETDMNGSREVIMQFWGNSKTIRIGSNWSFSGAFPTTTSSSNMYVGPTGVLSKSSSSKKYKLATENLDVDYRKVWGLMPKSWYDKNNSERYAELLTRKHNGEDVDFDCEPIRRIPGLLAEDVHNAGLHEFVVYDLDGNVEGIMYDRLWILLIPITRDHETRLNEYDERIGTIESRIDKLEQEIDKLKGVV